MRGTNTGDIVAYVTAVKAGSFADAARGLGLSRSAVAKAVGRLEARLGVRLLNRTTRAFSVTEEGQRFYEQCTEILDDLEAAENNAAGRDAKPKGTLRITAPGAYGQLHIMPVVRRFLADWPDVSVELSLTDRVVDIVEEGFDLAIRIGGLVNTPQDLISRGIKRYSTIFCASPEYLALYGTPETAESLRDHVCLLYYSSKARVPSQHAWRIIGPDGSHHSISGRQRFVSDRGEALLAAALSGMGIAQLPAFLFEPHIEAGRLIKLLPEYPTEEVPISVLYPSKRYLPAKVRAFVDALVQAVKDERDL